MADTVSYTTMPQGPQAIQDPENPCKLNTHFLFKAAIAMIFLVVIPLFPSQTPESINQILNTRGWELLQLIFVGIAVSYGLFSKRIDETEKEYCSKFDNAQSYVSRMLQVSSVFDDEAENLSLSDDNKFQTWNSQYYRGEPVVVVAQESSVHEEQKDITSQIGEKPLLLPVRSLKSDVFYSDANELTHESSVGTASLSRSGSNAGSKRFSTNSRKCRNGEFGGCSPLDSEKSAEENVLPSPIPWRSRSGRMERKEDSDDPPLYSLPSSMEDPEFNQLESYSFRAQPSHSSRKSSPSANKISPSPSFSSPKYPSSPYISSEFQGKNIEDLVRKKSYHRSLAPPVPPPPPPPLPPPPFLHKPPLVKSKSCLTNNHVSTEKEFKRSIRSAPNELNRTNSGSEPRPRTQSECPILGNSVGTSRLVDQTDWETKAAVGEYGKNGKVDKEAAFTEYIGRTDESTYGSVPPDMKQTTPQLPKEEEEFVEEMMETDEETESEDDYFEGSSGHKEVASDTVSDEGPDVDKKADEFIAKFREQIRLQRISSIRKSTEHLLRNSAR